MPSVLNVTGSDQRRFDLQLAGNGPAGDIVMAGILARSTPSSDSRASRWVRERRGGRCHVRRAMQRGVRSRETRDESARRSVQCAGAAPESHREESRHPEEDDDMNRAALAAVMLLAASAASAQARASATLASAPGGNVAGTVIFAQEGRTVIVVAEVTGLKPGPHGFHVHEKGDCSAPDFTSAGGHFNPGSQPHGNPTRARHHAGDMPLLVADASGGHGTRRVATREHDGGERHRRQVRRHPCGPRRLQEPARGQLRRTHRVRRDQVAHRPPEASCARLPQRGRAPWGGPAAR